MLREENGTEGSQAASLVRLITQDRFRAVGQPLSACGDRIEAGPPSVVSCAGGKILSVETGVTPPGDAVGTVDAFLLPAFSDPHIHLVGAAVARLGEDLSRDPPRDLGELEARVRAARVMGGWLRLSGFDETCLGEGRAPTLRELDAWAPDRPLRIRHRTRHASLLNGAAVARLRAAGAPLPEPVGAQFVNAEASLSRVLPPHSRAELGCALDELGAELLAAGVHAVDDVTATNDAARVALLAGAGLPQRVRAWLAHDADLEAAQAAAGGRIEIAGRKLLPTSAEEVESAGFREIVERARLEGLPLAVHAVEADVIAAVVNVLANAPPRRPGGPRGLDRLEHASLCPPELVERIAAAGLGVVTQTSFLATRGAKYRAEVEAPLQDWLYPVASLLEAGVPVALSSDAPVAPPDPALSFETATRRGTPPIGACEAISAGAAFACLVEGAPRIAEEPAGAWSPGTPASFLVLGRDPRPDGFRGLDTLASCLATRGDRS